MMTLKAVSAAGESEEREDDDGDPITANTLRALRVQAGLSQRELGRRIGWSHAQISNWEKRRHRIPLAAWPCLLDLFTRLQSERIAWQHQTSQLLRRARRP